MTEDRYRLKQTLIKSFAGSRGGFSKEPLVPKYLTAYGFVLKKVDETRIDETNRYVIKMYMSSWILRGFVTFTYPE